MGRGLWITLLVAGVISATACGRRQSHESGARSRAAHPTLGVPVSPLTDSVLAEMSSALGPWTRRWAQVLPGFTLDSLYRNPPERFEPAYARRLEPHDLRRARFFGAISPDSSWIVEADSYRTLVDGAPELWGEPDSAPALVDLEADSLRILTTAGTAGGFEDAYWMDSSRFLITGYGERQFEPWVGGGDVWVYDLSRGTLTRYNTPDVGKAAYDRYLDLAKAELRKRYSAPAL